MAAPAETSVEERFDDGDGEPGSNEPATEREHVRVVVLAGVLRRRHVVAHRRANPGDHVRGHAASDAGAVDHDAELRGATRNRARDSHGIVRVVYRRRARRAVIGDGMSEVAKSGRHRISERDATVVGADRDSPRCWCDRGGLGLFGAIRRSTRRDGRLITGGASARRTSAPRERLATLQYRPDARRDITSARCHDGGANVDLACSVLRGAPHVALGDHSHPWHAKKVSSRRRVDQRRSERRECGDSTEDSWGYARTINRRPSHASKTNTPDAAEMAGPEGRSNGTDSENPANAAPSADVTDQKNSPRMVCDMSRPVTAGSTRK